ncbi:MAG: DUF2974 domain-containing protein [Candidatus Improbicoccus devescovinae]|nr:MAG: DUF2974 domain-containing protein [Candidatus Improbicoccus devescovinae]
MNFFSKIKLFMCFIFLNSITLASDLNKKEDITDRHLLILSNIIYENSEPETVKELIKNYKNHYEIPYKKPISLFSSKEFKDLKIIQREINKTTERHRGFSAVTFQKDNNIIIVFRGSDQYFRENVSYLIPKKEHAQAKYAIKYIKKLINMHVITQDTNLYFTGHSLGGYLALYASGVLLNMQIKGDKITFIKKNDETKPYPGDIDFKSCIKKIVIFNGLGLATSTNLKIKNSLLNIKDKIYAYRLKGDPISLFGMHFSDQIEFICPNIYDEVHNKYYYFLVGSHNCYHFFKLDYFKLNSNKLSTSELITASN